MFGFYSPVCVVQPVIWGAVMSLMNPGFTTDSAAVYIRTETSALWSSGILCKLVNVMHSSMHKRFWCMVLIDDVIHLYFE